MSETPRVDAHARMQKEILDVGTGNGRYVYTGTATEIMPAEEAREIERDLAAVTAERDAKERRLAAIMPLFQEARDALSAISKISAKRYKVRRDLGDRMDDVGVPYRWSAREVAAGYTPTITSEGETK